MKNPNLSRNAKENNPMYGRHHSIETRQLMSERQRLRYSQINRLLFKLREDQLNDRIAKIVSNFSTPTISIESK